MEVDIERKVAKVYRTFYRKLLIILPVEDIVRNFYSRELISNDHKKEIDSYSCLKDKIKYFLDDVIHPSIQIGLFTQFNEMLVVMESSDNIAVKFVADNIKKGLPSCVSPIMVKGMKICHM